MSPSEPLPAAQDTIARDMKQIFLNLRLVVFPFGSDREQQAQALRNWDLWGPMVSAPASSSQTCTGHARLSVKQQAQGLHSVILQCNAERRKRAMLKVWPQLQLSGLSLRLRPVKRASSCLRMQTPLLFTRTRLEVDVSAAALQLFTLVLASCLSIGYNPPSAVFSVRLLPCSRWGKCMRFALSHSHICSLNMLQLLSRHRSFAIAAS